MIFVENNNGKYTLPNLDKLPSLPSFYLPPLFDVIQLLGFSTNYTKALPLIAGVKNQPLPFGTSTLAKLDNEGVGKGSIEKITQWIASLNVPMENLSDKKMIARIGLDLKVGSNASSWRPAVEGIKATEMAKFQGLTTFLDNRAETDYKIFKPLKKYHSAIRRGEFDKKSMIMDVWPTEKHLWQNNSLIPEAELDAYEEFVFLLGGENKPTHTQIVRANSASLYMRFDFYLSFIAHCEFTIAYFLDKKVANFSAETFTSIIAQAAKQLQGQEDVKTFTDAMFHEFKAILESYSEKDQVGFRELASFISIKEKSNGSETTNDKQYRILRRWRREELPSDKTLISFLKNAIGSVGHNDYLTFFVYFKFARLLDEVTKLSLALFKDKDGNQYEGIKEQIYATLSRYDLYYDQAKENCLTQP